MDISEQEERNEIIYEDRMHEGRRGDLWNPSTKSRQQAYLKWLDKQIRQRQKTLDLDGVTHSPLWKEELRKQKRAFQEEYKRIKDLIEDGR